MQNVGAAIFGVLEAEAADSTELRPEYRGSRSRATDDEETKDILDRTASGELTQRTIEAHLRDHIDSADMLGANDDSGKTGGGSGTGELATR